ncbi:hypothetical protein GCM10018987_10270 [Streptomyces cremeus]
MIRSPPRMVSARRRTQQDYTREADQECCPLGHMSCPQEAGDTEARIPPGFRDGRAETLDNEDGAEQPQQSFA